jgi:hypothetical protein
MNGGNKVAGENIDTVEANTPIGDNVGETEAIAKRSRDWIGVTIFAAAAGAPLLGLIAAVGSGWGLWGWENGAKGLGYSVGLALITIAFSAFAIWRGRKTGKKGSRLLRWGGLAIALAYALWMGSGTISGWKYPAIHDISTDLADPPAFQVLTLRDDNWDQIPGAQEDDMRGLSPQQRWRALHQEVYSDVRTVRVNQPMPTVMAKAARLAADRGWDIAANLPAEGRLEATATSGLFRFKDDIVLRVRPADNGAESIIDMRSVSRVGTGDDGVNAHRIMTFLADLEGTVSSAQ